MADIDHIEVRYNRKVQLEQYEPMEHGVVLGAELDDDEDWREVYEELSDQAEDEVERAIARRATAKKLGPDAEEDGA